MRLPCTSPEAEATAIPDWVANDTAALAAAVAACEKLIAYEVTPSTQVHLYVCVCDVVVSVVDGQMVEVGGCCCRCCGNVAQVVRVDPG